MRRLRLTEVDNCAKVTVVVRGGSHFVLSHCLPRSRVLLGDTGRWGGRPEWEGPDNILPGSP